MGMESYNAIGCIHSPQDSRRHILDPFPSFGMTPVSWTPCKTSDPNGTTTTTTKSSAYHKEDKFPAFPITTTTTMRFPTGVFVVVPVSFWLEATYAQNATRAPTDTIPEGVTVCDADEASATSTVPFAAIRSFCVNGAPCPSNSTTASEDFLSYCDCPSGLAGPHCEFFESLLPICDLDCANGTCVLGIESLAQVDDWMASPAGLEPRCECNKGYSGEACDQKGVPCGQYDCFNGATCVSTELDDGRTEYFCDCTTAHDGNTSYAGRFCESPSTSSCNEFADHNGRQFCVNGGSCRSDSFLGCDCPEGFIGPICEFTYKEIEYTECNLECENFGICRKGAKDLSLVQAHGLGNRHLLEESFSEDFEHCVCPQGFVGLRCEFKMEVCPGSSQVCLNGAECIPHTDDNGFKFVCDCESAQNPFAKYAGEYCEYESTGFCTIDGAKPGSGPGHDVFCVNGGDCAAYVKHGEEHPGCLCGSDFHGSHCEYSGNSLDEKEALYSNDRRRGPVLLILGSICFAFVTAGTLYFTLRTRQRRSTMNATTRYITNYSDSADLPPSTKSTREFQDQYDLHSSEDFDSSASNGGDFGVLTGVDGIMKTIDLDEDPDSETLVIFHDEEPQLMDNVTLV